MLYIQLLISRIFLIASLLSGIVNSLSPYISFYFEKITGLTPLILYGLYTLLTSYMAYYADYKYDTKVIIIFLNFIYIVLEIKKNLIWFV